MGGVGERGGGVYGRGMLRQSILSFPSSVHLRRHWGYLCLFECLLVAFPFKQIKCLVLIYSLAAHLTSPPPPLPLTSVHLSHSSSTPPLLFSNLVAFILFLCIGILLLLFGSSSLNLLSPLFCFLLFSYLSSSLCFAFYLNPLLRLTSSLPSSSPSCYLFFALLLPLLSTLILFRASPLLSTLHLHPYKSFFTLPLTSAFYINPLSRLYSSLFISLFISFCSSSYLCSLS